MEKLLAFLLLNIFRVSINGVGNDCLYQFDSGGYDIFLMEDEEMVEFDMVPTIITDVMAGHAKWQPQKTALVFGSERYTWLEFNQKINKVGF